MGQAESRQEQFWEACGFGHVDKVKELIDEGVDVNWISKTVSNQSTTVLTRISNIMTIKTFFNSC